MPTGGPSGPQSRRGSWEVSPTWRRQRCSTPRSRSSSAGHGAARHRRRRRTPRRPSRSALAAGRGRVLTLELRDSLKLGRTYTLFVGGGARDRHGNALAQPAHGCVHDRGDVPARVLDGKLEVVGFSARRQCCSGAIATAARRTAPRATSTRSASPTGGALPDQRSRRAGHGASGRSPTSTSTARSNPRATVSPAPTRLARADHRGLGARPARAHGQSARAQPVRGQHHRDTLNDSLGVLGWGDRGLRHDAQTALRGDRRSGFDFRWDPGAYRMRAFPDLDRNKAWKREANRRSEEMRIVLTPGGSSASCSCDAPTPGARRRRQGLGP